MKSTADPRRLVEAGSDAPDFLRRALEVGHADVPSSANLAGLARRVPLAHRVGPTNPPAAPPLGGGSAVWGVALGTLLAAGTAALWIPPRPSAPHGSQVAPAATQGAEERSIESAEPRPAVEANRGAAPSEAASVAPTSSAREDPAPQRLAPASSAAGSPGPSAAPPSRTMSEVEILAPAKEALKQSPARALELTNEHAARFPGGVLTQEREVIAIEALVALGRGAEARQRAASFVAHFPASAHRRRIEVLLAQSADAPPPPHP